MSDLYRIEHQFKFSTKSEAEKEANTIAKYIDRAARQNNISCKAVICISEYNIRNAYPSLRKNGKRGRPKVVFMDKYRLGHPAKKIAPHLHILLKSEKVCKLSKMVVHNINNRHRKRHPDMANKVVSRHYPVIETPEKYVAYTMHQKSELRFVEYDEKGILNDFDFKTEYEKYKPNLF
ncbi:MAG: hypothetical protein WCY19_02685 [Candidatus Gastranaerophilaceae bacterium]